MNKEDLEEELKRVKHQLKIMTSLYVEQLVLNKNK